MDNKPLTANAAQANWESRLLKDLSFIKKHRRYPLSKKTLMPVAGIILFVVLLLRFSWPVIFVNNNPSYVPYIAAIVCMTGIVNVIWRYTSVLKFRKIPTDFYVQENMELLNKFFRIQQLAYTQHPEAPEVFMIISRAIGGNDNYREVMIYIADDKQILVNSHFAGQKFTITPPSRQYRLLASRLEGWIAIHLKQQDGTSVSVSKF